MNLSQITSENADNLTYSQIETILRPIYPIGEWDNMTFREKIRECFLFFVYVKHDNLRQSCTLDQFLNEMRSVHLILNIEPDEDIDEADFDGFDVYRYDLTNFVNLLSEAFTHYNQQTGESITNNGSNQPVDQIADVPATPQQNIPGNLEDNIDDSAQPGPSSRVD